MRLSVQRSRYTPRAPHAFTLIELLVVVAIIALLIAILLPSLGIAKAQSRRTVGATRLKAISSAMGIYAGEWEGKFPLCQRAYQASGFRSGAGLGVDNIQRVGHYSYNSLATWLAPDQLRIVQNDFAIMNFWLSPGCDVTNPFLLKLYGDPNQPKTYWANYHDNNVWYNPGGYKGVTFMGYFFFAGDEGNKTAGVGNVYFTDSGVSVPYTKFDLGKGKGTRWQGQDPSDILMQDILQQEPAPASFYDCNYTTTGAGTLKESYALTPGSGAQLYIQGTYICGAETDMAGANVAYADGSVQWRKTRDCDKVYYKSPNGAVTLLYIGQAR